MITRERLVMAAKEIGRLLLTLAVYYAVIWVFEHFWGLGWLPLIVFFAWGMSGRVWSIVKDVRGIVADRRAARAWKRRVARYMGERKAAGVVAEPVPPLSVTQVRDAVGNIWERSGTNRWDVVFMSEDLPGERVRLQVREDSALGWGRLSEILGPLVPVDLEEPQ